MHEAAQQAFVLHACSDRTLAVLTRALVARLHAVTSAPISLLIVRSDGTPAAGADTCSAPNHLKSAAADAAALALEFGDPSESLSWRGARNVAHVIAPEHRDPRHAGGVSLISGDVLKGAIGLGIADPQVRAELVRALEGFRPIRRAL